MGLGASVQGMDLLDAKSPMHDTGLESEDRPNRLHGKLEQTFENDLHFRFDFLSIRLLRHEREVDRGLSLVSPPESQVVGLTNHRRTMDEVFL
jgi:hypothetical protein